MQLHFMNQCTFNIFLSFFCLPEDFRPRRCLEVAGVYIYRQFSHAYRAPYRPSQPQHRLNWRYIPSAFAVISARYRPRLRRTVGKTPLALFSASASPKLGHQRRGRPAAPGAKTAEIAPRKRSDGGPAQSAHSRDITACPFRCSEAC